MASCPRFRPESRKSANFHFVDLMATPHQPLLLCAGMAFRLAGKCGMSAQYLNRFLNEKRANKFSKKKEKASTTIEECGKCRPGVHGEGKAELAVRKS